MRSFAHVHAAAAMSCCAACREPSTRTACKMCPAAVDRLSRSHEWRHICQVRHVKCVHLQGMHWQKPCNVFASHTLGLYTMPVTFTSA